MSRLTFFINIRYKTLASKEIFVIYKNIKGITYRIEYYENENADVEVILNNQVDLVGNIIEVNHKSNNMKYTFDYNEEGNIETTKYNQNGKEIIISNTKEDDYKTIKKITLNGNTREEKYIYSKDLNSYLEDIQLSNGSVINQKLDQLNRVKSISINNNSRTFEYLQNGDSATNLITDEWYSEEVEGVNIRTGNLSYKYDDKGNIIEIRENGKLKSRYEYDSISRLIREDNYDFKETYLIEYDVGGNIINRRRLPLTDEKTSKIHTGEVVNYLYRNDNWKDQLISYNGEFFKYDNMGNPIVYKGNTLKWIKGSLLDSYEDSSNNQTYKYEYNHKGIRISKTIEGKKTNYYLEGNHIIAQDDGNILYFHYGTDGVVGFTYEGVGEYFYKKNIQGDVIGIYDSTGVEFARYEYDAWGNHKIKVLVNEQYVDINEINEPSNIVKNYIFLATLNPFRYRSYYYDSETGLFYCNSRYYSPELCRWISPDDVEYLDPESINGLNLYCYCGDNPVNRLDSNGNSWKWSSFGHGVGYLITGIGAIAAGALVIASGVATLPILLVAGITIGAGALTTINGVSEMIEAGTGYNFVKEIVFGGNSSAYNTYASITGSVATIGSIVCGGWYNYNTPRIQAYKNIGSAEFPKSYYSDKIANRPYFDSVLTQKNIIKYGNMGKNIGKNGSLFYSFTAKGSSIINGNFNKGIYELVLTSDYRWIWHLLFKGV